jgi:hypothetical protein
MSVIVITAIEAFSVCSVSFNLQCLAVPFWDSVHNAHLKAHRNMFQFFLCKVTYPLYFLYKVSHFCLIILAQSYLRYCTLQVVITVCSDGGKSEHSVLLLCEFKLYEFKWR